MQIEIDSRSGFCYGVVKTIQMAEEALSKGEPVYCLGEIVHNEEEVERLKSKGLVIIDTEDLKDIEGATVLIRAHGEPPATYKAIDDRANLLKEGTCPIVLHLQKKVRAAWEEMKKVNGQVVIYGKQGHAEVIGLAGQTDHEAIVISKADDIVAIDFAKPIALFAQTTQSIGGFEAIITAIRQQMLNYFSADAIPLKINDSICRHVSTRGEHLVEFSKSYDVIVFVSGTNSSNGKVLFATCTMHNPRSYCVASADMLEAGWFLNATSVGIAGATSTPRWLMEEVAERIKALTII